MPPCGTAAYLPHCHFSSFEVQADLGDIGDAVLDHCNKANIAVKQADELFGFSVHVTVTFTLHCSPLSVQ